MKRGFFRVAFFIALILSFYTIVTDENMSQDSYLKILVFGASLVGLDRTI